MDMYFRSKKTSLVILGATALVCSRAMFLFLNDPEGTNLLVVIGMTAIVYFVSLSVFVFNPSIKLLSFLPSQGIKRLLSVVLIQILIVFVLYFCLR